MKPTWTQTAMHYAGALALVCWIVMFLAGTDIWHDMGRPDWRLQGAHDADLRAFAFAFYVLPLCLAAHFILTIVSVRRAAPTSPSA